MPTVSVVMAVYNGERFVREAIDSILGQTFSDFEFLIINDGSTDRTRTVLESYNDPRIRLIENEQNLGLTKSLNRGLKLAQGKYIARQDDDDISLPDRLARQVAFLEAHPEVALLGTWYEEIDEQGVFVHRWRFPCDYTQIRWSLLFFCPIVHTAAMFRAATIEQVGPYNETLSYSQDYELWTRIARCFPVANLDDYLVKVRTNPYSMTATYGDRSQEGRRMRVASVTRLLGWDGLRTLENDARFSTLASFAFGYQPELSLDMVQWAAPTLVRLQRVFCDASGIDEIECVTHRARLFGRISRRLIERATRCLAAGDSAAAWRLLILVMRLWWRALLTQRGVLLMLRVLTYSRLSNGLRQFQPRVINK